jgi:hypothetical protein
VNCLLFPSHLVQHQQAPLSLNRHFQPHLQCSTPALSKRSKQACSRIPALYSQIHHTFPCSSPNDKRSCYLLLVDPASSFFAQLHQSMYQSTCDRPFRLPIRCGSPLLSHSCNFPKHTNSCSREVPSSSRTPKRPCRLPQSPPAMARVASFLFPTVCPSPSSAPMTLLTTSQCPRVV